MLLNQQEMLEKGRQSQASAGISSFMEYSKHAMFQNVLERLSNHALELRSSLICQVLDVESKHKAHLQAYSSCFKGNWEGTSFKSPLSKLLHIM